METPLAIYYCLFDCYDSVICCLLVLIQTPCVWNQRLKEEKAQNCFLQR